MFLQDISKCDLVFLQDISEPVMTVREITGRLEELDAALRLVESEGRGLEEKIRKGIMLVLQLSHAVCLYLLGSRHSHVTAKWCNTNFMSTVGIYRLNDYVENKRSTGWLKIKYPTRQYTISLQPVV